MRTNNATNIKHILGKFPPGSIVTARELLYRGVPRELQRSWVRSGWLKHIGVGAYTVLDGELLIEQALRSLQEGLHLSVHIGAYTALSEKHGKTHNILLSHKTELFSYRGEKLPVWFTSTFKDKYQLILTSLLPPELGLVDIESDSLTVKVSSVERAMLELLYLTPRFHTLQESYQIMELITSAKPDLVQELLQHTTSIQVKRLFLLMAEQAGHGWFKRIDLSKIDLGSGIRQIEKGGTLNQKYEVVIGDLRGI